MELGGALQQVVPDALGNGLTLGDELGGVELGDDGLEDFVADGREDSLVVVLAEGLGGDLVSRDAIWGTRGRERKEIAIKEEING